MASVKRRALLGATFIGAGLNHFRIPKTYEAIMPDYVPAHREMVQISGVAEAACGVGVLSERTSRVAGWWLIATLVAIFPANVHMALNPDRYKKIPEAALWARLPVQALFILWVWRVAIQQR
jgi:uncharacterized membrane protein